MWITPCFYIIMHNLTIMADLNKKYHDAGFAILLADDQKFMLKNLERYFKEYFSVITASTLEEAKEAITLHNVGIVVSDHQMLDGQGIELLEYIRDQHNDIRRIVITADRREQVVIDLMNDDLGHSFVFKPTVKPQLHQAIAEQSEIYLQKI